MTYNVFGGTINVTQSINQSQLAKDHFITALVLVTSVSQPSVRTGVTRGGVTLTTFF